MAKGNGFTGRGRRVTTRRSVRVADFTARSLITVGGIGTIVAVATVCIFLIAVVLPLFRPAHVELASDQPGIATTDPVEHLEVDEYRTIGFTCTAAGKLTVFRLDDGSLLEQRSLFEELAPTAISFGGADASTIVGFDDGRVQLLRIGFRTDFLRAADVPDDLLDLAVGAVAPLRAGMVQRTPEGQFRLQTLKVERIGSPYRLADGRITAIHHAVNGTEIGIAALVAAPGGTRLVHLTAEEAEDFLTGDVTFRYGVAEPLPYPSGGVDATFVRVAGDGGTVYAAWRDGSTMRVRTRGDDGPFVAESIRLTDAGTELTALEFLLGGETLISGTSDGALRGWYTVPEAEAGGVDGFRLFGAKLADRGAGSAVRAIASASRRRMFVASFENGALAVYAMTGEQRIASMSTPSGRPATGLEISPKENAIVALAADRLLQWSFEAGHPEATLGTMFSSVNYEGYAERNFAWQSSSATDDFEPKLSLIPLIFGTLKATFYSVIIGAPLALLAAIYTSEFLDPKWKAWIKPTIEMMASLPSVVLGFLAALVIAPFVERVLPATIAGFITVPFAFLVGAHLWQTLPSTFTTRWRRHRIVFVAPFLPLGILAAVWLGPIGERILFGSDLLAWLNGLHAAPAVGHALGGWFVLLLPLGATVAAVLLTRVVERPIRRATEHLSRRLAAWVPLVKFVVGTVLTLGLVLVASTVLSGVGLDIRKPVPLLGSVADTFDQRNALIVGFVMGFAIIPIIYTLADDALSTVPEHLRAASLGAGATPWQTALRIVVPTAMSGLFSALMIGLGRAVGETMIVLMAAGNTPVMSMNIFEGFRTLSANIAVELPEAPVGETHYRTLFLAALTLFAMTFLVNTVAEAVRLRFRRRAYQL
jgi:phosphate transport system permease protein